MRLLVLAALLLAGLTAPAISCDAITAGPGATIRFADGKSGGMFSVGCIFGEKWEIRAHYIGEQRIYDGLVVIDAYPAISASKLWMFRDGKRFRPVLSVGLLAKGSQRCRYDGDINCNRVLPLPFCFLASAGVKWGDVLITLSHCSNASLDYGPEKKNLGLDALRAELWF